MSASLCDDCNALHRDAGESCADALRRENEHLRFALVHVMLDCEDALRPGVIGRSRRIALAAIRARAVVALNADIPS